MQTKLEFATSKATHTVSSLAKSAAVTPLPTSLSWIYGFGFKIGIFLLLKSFLVVRYTSLSITGWWMVGTQAAQALVLIVVGLLLQEDSTRQSPHALCALDALYLIAAIYSTVICVLKERLGWTFFREAARSNWLVNTFNSAVKGAKEASLSILFWDTDLWTAFCWLLGLLTLTYAIVTLLKERDKLPQA